MIATTDLLSQFEDEITTSNRLPYLQIRNPNNLPLADIRKLGLPYGWFIPSEEAERAEFKANESFKPTRLSFGESDSKENDGFLAKQVRLSILQRSDIEVQQKANKGWRYIGKAYKYGEITSFGELVKSDRDNYRLRTRYLILFLGEDNQPLHHIPFQLGMNAGVGAAFSQEVRSFRKEIEETFFKLRNQPVKALSDRAHALTTLNLTFDAHKTEGKAPFLCPSIRFAPAIDNLGQKIIVTRRDRKVTLVNQKIEFLLIPKLSDTGKLILSLWEEHQDFATKYQQDTPDSTQPAEQPVEHESDFEEIAF